MSDFEYKVIPAPRRAEKAKGVRGNEARFAHTVTNKINTLASEGWEYFRAESLPVDEKASLMGKSVERYQSLLIFRREKPDVPAYEPSVTGETSAADPSMLSLMEEEATNAAEITPVGAATRD